MNRALDDYNSCTQSLKNVNIPEKLKLYFEVNFNRVSPSEPPLPFSPLPPTPEHHHHVPFH